MKTNKIKKKMYVPPTLEILHIALDGNIAVQSPVQKVDVKGWESEGIENERNNSDIWLDW